MYEASIEIIYGKIEYQIEESIFKAIQNVGINVDRDKLIKALRYDRDQYNKGYADGRRIKVKMLYRKASEMWTYKVIDVSLDDLLQMAQQNSGIILSLNDEKGQEDTYLSNDCNYGSYSWYNKLLTHNNRDTLDHIFNDKYVITQYDDWME